MVAHQTVLLELAAPLERGTVLFATLCRMHVIPMSLFEIVLLEAHNAWARKHDTCLGGGGD